MCAGADPAFYRALNERMLENGLLGPYAKSLNDAAGFMSGTITPREFYAIKAKQLDDQFSGPEGMMGFMPFGGVVRGDKTWFKGMYPHDWTKEVRRGKELVDPGPVIDPSQINRSTPFPTFGGERESLEGIRGFFAKDPEVASRFAEPRMGAGHAVFPVEIDGARAMTIDAKGKPAGEIQFGKSGKKFQDAVSSGKYDVVYIRNTADEGDIAVALRGSDIRSAIR